jgi:branched-chain amino acid transport system ATP-binding protein
VSVLQVEALRARHGLLQAVNGISLSIDKGETLALVGANGAGKTTLLRTIAGAHPAAGGKVILNGRDVSHAPAYQRVAQGIALAPEGRRLFARLTVEENLQLARYARRPGRWTLESVMETFPNLKARRKTLAGALSGGEQQATAIGRALMTNPDVLLLDEVSLGLAPIVVDRLYVQLGLLREFGVATVIVEQDLARAMGAAERVICMIEGHVAIEGRTAELTRDVVTEAYFGMRQGHARQAAGSA